MKKTGQTGRVKRARPLYSADESLPIPQSPEKTLDYTHRDYERVLDVVPRPDYGAAII
jgi:hypothetical protein